MSNTAGKLAAIEARVAAVRAQILTLQDRVIAAEAAHRTGQATVMKRRVLTLAAYLESELARLADLQEPSS